jgi:hypothetical protein
MEEGDNSNESFSFLDTKHLINWIKTNDVKNREQEETKEIQQ